MAASINYYHIYVKLKVDNWTRAFIQSKDSDIDLCDCPWSNNQYYLRAVGEQHKSPYTYATITNHLNLSDWWRIILLDTMTIIKDLEFVPYMAEQDLWTKVQGDA